VYPGSLQQSQDDKRARAKQLLQLEISNGQDKYEGSLNEVRRVKDGGSH